MEQNPPEIGPHVLIPRFRNDTYEAESLARRRAWLEEATGASAKHIAACSFNSEQLRGNIENPVGVSQVPMGVAGPVLVDGQHARGLYYVPMSTTEGALIRSYERGMVVLTHAGGVKTAVLQDENHISPVLQFDDIVSARRFCMWARDHENEIRAQAEATTKHGKLTGSWHLQIGRHVLLEIGFSTADAQGMNMISKAADAVCRWIRENYKVGHFVLFSGLSSEKRASGYILTRGKGKRVTAGALLPDRLLKIGLHATAEELAQVWHATLLGHLQAGSIGFTAHAANGLAAMFIATGQDVATVANAACALTNFELHPEGLYVSITIPALTVATVGGGTALPTQREALEMMGCYGAGNAKKLAEIMAAAILGGEISMAAALASGEFVAAHERYGRNRPR